MNGFEALLALSEGWEAMIKAGLDNDFIQCCVEEPAIAAEAMKVAKAKMLELLKLKYGKKTRRNKRPV